MTVVKKATAHRLRSQPPAQPTTLMEATPHEVPRNRGASPPPRLAPARPPPLQRSQLISPPVTRKSQTTTRLSMALSRRVRVNPLLQCTLTNSVMLLQPPPDDTATPPPPLKSPLEDRQRPQ
ncbi:hypothetical protein MTO96_022844 [Rhipicephalus appendiculatus]